MASLLLKRGGSQTAIVNEEAKISNEPLYTFVPSEPGQTETSQTSGQSRTGNQIEGKPTASRINAALEKYYVFRAIEEKTGIPKLYVAFFLTICAAICGMYLIGLRKTSNTIAFVYPAYMSYKTLEANNYEDHLHWLTYWVVYGVLDILHGVFDATFYWLPYYELLQFAFLFWLFLPRTKGCSSIYNLLIRPILQSNEESIDKGLDAAAEKAKKVSAEVRSMSGELIATILAIFFKTIATGVHTIGDSAASFSNSASPPLAQQHNNRRPSQSVPVEYQKKQS